MWHRGDIVIVVKIFRSSEQTDRDWTTPLRNMIWGEERKEQCQRLDYVGKRTAADNTELLLVEGQRWETDSIGLMSIKQGGRDEWNLLYGYIHHISVSDKFIKQKLSQPNSLVSENKTLQQILGKETCSILILFFLTMREIMKNKEKQWWITERGGGH